MQYVDNKYNFLKAIKTSKLQRLGRTHDGGYVVNSDAIDQCNTLITFGLGPDWSFELDYIEKNKDAEVFIYDHTVSSFPYIKDIIKYFRRFITFRATWKSVSDRIKYLSNFRSFIKHKKVNYFSEKITYPMIDKIDTDLDKVFGRILNTGEVVLKCDIDGGEYNVIDGILKYSSRIKMLIFEFHLVDNNEKNFYNSIKKIQEQFDIIHIHGNNHFQKLESGLPLILEITLINKKYAPKNPDFIYNFPIDGLDHPNNPYKEDLFFSFRE
ncbi:hypothetical protein OAT08_03580 [Pelagibacteraceae bacterium]|jgi:hypothetical protein|nr:hypothetical protein [Pelagibacteraceae bacterium]